jgi:hypothetical protein
MKRYDALGIALDCTIISRGSAGAAVVPAWDGTTSSDFCKIRRHEFFLSSAQMTI